MCNLCELYYVPLKSDCIIKSQLRETYKTTRLTVNSSDLWFMFSKECNQLSESVVSAGFADRHNNSLPQQIIAVKQIMGRLKAFFLTRPLTRCHSPRYLSLSLAFTLSVFLPFYAVKGKGVVNVFSLVGAELKSSPTKSN